MKSLSIGIIVFLLTLIISSVVSYSIHDYFYELKMKECDAIMSSDYQVSTDSVTECHKIDVNKFWNYDIGYWIAPMAISLMIAFLVIMIISLNDLTRGF